MIEMNKQARKEWESIEWIIERHLKAIDSEIQKFHGRTAIFSTSRKVRDKFISKRLPELLIKVTEG